MNNFLFLSGDKYGVDSYIKLIEDKVKSDNTLRVSGNKVDINEIISYADFFSNTYDIFNRIDDSINQISKLNIEFILQINGISNF